MEDLKAGGVVAPSGRGGGLIVRVVLVGSLVWLVACGLGAWTVGRAFVAPSGAPSPSAAVMGVFASFSPWADDDAVEVVRYLCRQRSAELRERVRGIRADLASVKNTELQASGYVESPAGKGVRVTVKVETVMALERGLFAHSRGLEWRFDAVGSGSTWRVCGWEAPEICGGHVECRTDARKD